MKRTLSIALLTVGLVATSTACWRHAYTVGSGAPDGSEVYDRWDHHWLWGLVGTGKVDIQKVCPAGNATIDERTTFLNGLVRFLTVGIYSPSTIKVLCADGNARTIELDEEDVRRIVHDPRFPEWVAEEAPELLSEVIAALESQEIPEPAATVAVTPVARESY